MNKIVWCMANPAVAGCILFSLGFSLLLTSRDGTGKRRATGLWLSGFALGWFYVWSISAFTRFVGGPLEKEFLVDGKWPTVDSFPTCDVIADMGGGIGADTNRFEHVSLYSSADRAYFSALLWKAGKAPIIVPSGKDIVNADRAFLIHLGVPDSAIVVENEARNTEENARFVGRLVQEHIVGRKVRVLVVTSAWHMKRTLLMFAKYAPEVEVIPAACDFECMPASGFHWMELMPNAEVFGRNAVYFHEWLGVLWYKFSR